MELAFEGIPSEGHGPDLFKGEMSDILNMTLDPEVKKCIVLASCNERLASSCNGMALPVDEGYLF